LEGEGVVGEGVFEAAALDAAFEEGTAFDGEIGFAGGEIVAVDGLVVFEDVLEIEGAGVGGPGYGREDAAVEDDGPFLRGEFEEGKSFGVGGDADDEFAVGREAGFPETWGIGDFVFLAGGQVKEENAGVSWVVGIGGVEEFGAVVRPGGRVDGEKFGDDVADGTAFGGDDANFGGAGAGGSGAECDLLAVGAEGGHFGMESGGGELAAFGAVELADGESAVGGAIDGPIG
jgi:hypothetical protein